MSFFDDIVDFFTGTSTVGESKTVSTTKDENVAQTKLGSKTAVGSKESGKVGSTLQTISLLDEQTGITLRDLLERIAISDEAAGTGAAADIASARDLSAFMKSRAIGGDNTADIAAIIEAARTQGTKDIGRANTQFAAQAGSGLNTVVEKLRQEGLTDLNVQLAGLEGQLNFEADKLQSQDLVSALASLTEVGKTGQAIGSDTIKSITQIAEILKGSEGTISVATEEQQTTNEVQAIIEAMQALTEGTTVSTTAGTGETSETSTILDWLSLPFFNKKRQAVA